MTNNLELQQQLWEFVYELLPPEEAASLADRISSDPDVARAYSEVKLQTELVRDAVRHDIAPLVLAKELPASAAPSQHTSTPTRRIPLLRQPFGNILSAVLAASLLLVVAYAYSPLAPVSELRKGSGDSPPRLTVLAPRTLQHGVMSPFTLQTRDGNEQPISAEIDVLVADSRNTEQWRRTVRTDTQGTAQFTVPVAHYASTNRLEFHVRDFEGALAPLVAPLAARESPLATYVSTDRRQYQPGETLLFRSVTQPSLVDVPLPEVEVEFEIVDQELQPIEGSRRQIRTIQGVGSGSFDLPAELSSGSYQLVARSPELRFPDSTLEFEVSSAGNDFPELQLAFSRDHYFPEEELVADVAVRHADGEPVSGVRFSVQGQVDARPLVFDPDLVTTDVDGLAQVRTQLPAQVLTGEGSLEFQFQQALSEQDESAQESPPLGVAYALPIQVPEVALRWYPEGGNLVERVQNQVYFSALDRRGRPVEIAGRLRNEEGDLIVEVKTSRPGAGKFPLTPRPGEVFDVELDQPEGWSVAAPSLLTASEQALTFRVRDSVIAMGEPLRLELFSHVPGRSLVASAFCQDVEVGRAAIRAQGDGRPQSLELPITATAYGMLRVAIHDYSDEVPVPRLLAERLVYCRPAREWKLALEEISPLPAPSETRQFRILAENTESSLGDDRLAGSEWFFQSEMDERRLALPPPVPATDPDPETDPDRTAPGMSVLGISLIDAEESVRWGRELPPLPNFFRILSRLERSSNLHEAWWRADVRDLSVAEIDLLLGTHHGRHRITSGQGEFVSPERSLAATNRDFAETTSELAAIENRFEGDDILAGAIVQPERLPRARPSSSLRTTIETAPRIYDNLGTIVAWQRELERERAEERRAFQFAVGRWLVILASLALTILALTALFRMARASYWIPSLAVAASCLLLGSIWLGLQSPLSWKSNVSSQLAFRSDAAPSESAVPPRMLKGSASVPRPEAPFGDLDALGESDRFNQELAEMSLFALEDMESEPPEDDTPLDSTPAMSGAAPPNGMLGRQPESPDDSLARRQLAEPTPLARSELSAMAMGVAPPMQLRSHAETLFRGVRSSPERERPRERRLSELETLTRRTAGSWNPRLTIHRSGHDESGRPPIVLFQPARTTKTVAALVTIHGPDGFGELRELVPLREPVSWELPVRSQLALGDELDLPLSLRNSGEHPQEARIHLSWDRDLLEIVDPEGRDETVTEALTAGTASSNANSHVRSVSLSEASVSELDLPRLRAASPGRGTVALWIELGDRDLREEWELDIVPDMAVQNWDETGWLERNAELVISLPESPSESPPEAAASNGYLYLMWRGYPSLAAEVHDAARVLTEQKLAASSNHREASVAAGSEPQADADVSVELSEEAESALDASIARDSMESMENNEAHRAYSEARNAVETWLNQEAVSAPDVRNWSLEWTRGHPTDGMRLARGYRSVATDAVTDAATAETSVLERELDDWRQTRGLRGGWSSVVETARGLRALTTDRSRPARAEQECTVRILGPDGVELIRSTVAATSSRPLEIGGWWEVDRNLLTALSPNGQLKLDIQLEGAARIPYVGHAALYLPAPPQPAAPQQPANSPQSTDSE